jgi:sec-independent protein translocase protein TatB
MFGIGFTEILLISIIAILFLGPDKLPGALMDMAKFIKSVKKTISETKSSLEEEMKLSDLKEEALGYKKQLNEATDELKNFKNLSFDNEDDITYDDDISQSSPMSHAKQAKNEPKEKETVAAQVESKNDDDVVTFKKLPKEKKPKVVKEKVAKNDKKDSKKGDA